MVSLFKKEKKKRTITLGIVGLILFIFAWFGLGLGDLFKEEQKVEVAELDVLKKQETLDESVRATFSNEILKLQERDRETAILLEMLQKQNAIENETNKAEKEKMTKEFKDNLTQLKKENADLLSGKMKTVINQFEEQNERNKKITEAEFKSFKDNISTQLLNDKKLSKEERERLMHLLDTELKEGRDTTRKEVEGKFSDIMEQFKVEKEKGLIESRNKQAKLEEEFKKFKNKEKNSKDGKKETMTIDEFKDKMDKAEAEQNGNSDPSSLTPPKNAGYLQNYVEPTPQVVTVMTGLISVGKPVKTVFYI